MSLVTLDDIQDYNEELAASHVDLLHSADRCAFARFKSESHITSIVNNGSPNIVVVAAVNGQRIGDMDDKQVRRGISFIFASRAATDIEAAEAIDAANKKAEEIMFDFMNKWDYDQQNECELLQNFDLEKVSWDDIDGPWLENYYGWMLFVPYKSDMPPYDPAKWNE